MSTMKVDTPFLKPVSVKLACMGAFRRFRFRYDDTKTADMFDNFINIIKVQAKDETAMLAWRDNDGDTILITCAEDLQEAVHNCQPGADGIPMLRLFSFPEKETQKETQEEETEGKTLKNVKSEPCEAQENSKENTPFVIKRRSQKRYAHENIVCDLCASKLMGTRFHCVVCESLDICETCERKGEHKEHAMIRFVNSNTYLPAALKQFLPK
ncbi:unnamed protein product [Caenorhabditis auriculariae]|uniref:ZZ-type domain-containing protein n=1 Tax=Caenorhabditis auriculariae TaxID=2777116 RepID=A0A8S1GTV1_9PELO|nr:unnamed protein product [Caenorhabditis auriculariae]